MNDYFYIYKRCLILLIFATCCSGIYSQSVLKHDAVSPEVGSLMRVQDHSVNLYTGRPHISVPLYSMKLKNFTYDLELLYNAEGHKPDMPVGNVGLGSSLTGGQIYRVANGVWDEVYTFIQYPDRTEREDWSFESNLRGYYEDLDNGTDENVFKEPDLDEFVINIGRINASFYMYQDREGKIVTKIASQNSPYFEVKDVKIGSFPEIPFAEDELYVPWMKHTYYPKISIVPRPVMFKEITIVDSDGIVYVFGGDVNSIDFSCEYFQDFKYEDDYDGYGRKKNIGTEGGWDKYNSYLYAIPSAWHIKKIILPNEKESIVFHYSKENVNIVERVDLHTSFVFGMYGPSNSNTVTLPDIPLDVNPEYYRLIDKVYDIVYPALLTGISASNGDFVELTSSRRNDLRTDGLYKSKELFLNDNYGGVISEIANNKCYSFKLDKIKTGTGKIIDFYYTDEVDRRLTLDSLRINRNELYKFHYNPLRLPGYSNTLTDNWGYYNGKDYYPRRGNLNFEELYAVRQPDSVCVKAEILERIVYPTGGNVHFQYELHSYSKIATQYPFEIKEESGVAGGLRIKRIIYSDNENPQITKTKEFLYQNEDGSSSGILAVVPRYSVRGRDYYTESNTQVNWADQFHMGYSRVIELLSDSSKTVYSFVNHDQVKDEPSVGDYTHGISDFLHHRYTSRKLDRGLLQSAQYYDAKGMLQKQESFEYHSDLSDYLKTINQFFFITGYPRRVSANKIYTYFPFLQKKETTLYVGNDSINETEEYEYNSYRLLTRTRKHVSEPQGSTPAEEITVNYLPDVMDEYVRTSSGNILSGSPLKVYDNMQAERWLNYPIETVTKRNGKVISANIMTYKMVDRLIVPAKEYKLETAVPLADYSPFKLTSSGTCSIDGRCVTEAEYLDFDSYGNPTNIVDKANVNTAYLWGYKGQYPIAKVVNARNTFKSVPRYREVRKTDYISLGNSTLTNLPQTRKFESSSSGIVTVHLEGQLGYNWFLQLKIDDQIIYLVQNRSSKPAGAPWDTYSKVYTFRQELYLPAGSHRLTIQAAQAYNSTSSSGYSGNMSLSYLTQESIAPDTSGSDDFFYENFEDSYGGVSLGYHSKRCHFGAYGVNVPTEPDKNYFIDYQVFKDGKWNYRKRDFVNGCDTIDEGGCPIDNVRVYPQNASITTYEYFPLVGLRCETDERGRSVAYQYDSMGKLAAIVDNEMNPLKKYDYSYQNQQKEPDMIYYNQEVSGTFIRSTCDASLGELGKPIDYVVPARKYSSTFSQEDANQKAYAELSENGQQYADENGECGANVILSVYNPLDTPYVLSFCWGIQGRLTYDEYVIPPSEKIADTGDILKDYKPVMIYLPRRNYRFVTAYQEDNFQEKVDLSLRSTEYNDNLWYTIEYYPDYQDIYVIGNYVFPRK